MRDDSSAATEPILDRKFSGPSRTWLWLTAHQGATIWKRLTNQTPKIYYAPERPNEERSCSHNRQCARVRLCGTWSLQVEDSIRLLAPPKNTQNRSGWRISKCKLTWLCCDTEQSFVFLQPSLLQGFGQATRCSLDKLSVLYPDRNGVANSEITKKHGLVLSRRIWIFWDLGQSTAHVTGTHTWWLSPLIWYPAAAAVSTMSCLLMQSTFPLVESS